MKADRIFTRYSIRHTLWAGGLLLGVLFLSITLYILYVQHQAYSVTQEVLDKHSRASETVVAMRNNLKNAVANLGLYLISQEPVFSRNYKEYAARLTKSALALKKHAGLTGNQASVVRRVIDNAARLVPMLTELATVDKAKPGHRLPAVKLMSEKLQPVQKKIARQLDALLSQARQNTIDYSLKSLGVQALPKPLKIKFTQPGVPEKKTGLQSESISRAQAAIKAQDSKRAAPAAESQAPPSAARPVKELPLPVLKLVRPPNTAKALLRLYRKVSAYRKQVVSQHRKLVQAYQAALQSQQKLLEFYRRDSARKAQKIESYAEAIKLRDRLIALYENEVAQLIQVTTDYHARLQQYQKLVQEYTRRMKQQNQLLEKLGGQQSILLARKTLQQLLADYRRQVMWSAQVRDAAALVLTWERVQGSLRAFLAFRSQRGKELLAARLRRFSEALSGFSGRHKLSGRHAAVVDDINKRLKQYKAVMAEVVALHMSPGWRRDIMIVNDKVGPVFKSLSADIDRLVSFVERKNRRQTTQAMEALEKNIGSVELLIALVFVAGAIVFGFIAYLVLRPLQQTVSAMRRAVDSGELDQPLLEQGRNEYCELGKWFNRFRARIGGCAGQVLECSTELARASSRLHQTMESSRQQAGEQLQEVNAVAEACDSVFSSLQQIQGQTAEAAKVTQSANDRAVAGQRVVDDAVQSIESLADQVQDASTAIESLADESSNICEVVEVIRNITEQTNLLALNAAIEAARAGEQGRGFAVVAEEVRALSRRVNEQTDAIQDRVNSLHQGIELAMNKMQRNRTQAEQSVGQAAEAGKVLKTLVDSCATIMQMVAQIAEATEGENGKTAKIDMGLERIRDIARLSADSAEASAAMANTLADNIDQLQRLVTQITAGGQSAS